MSSMGRVLNRRPLVLGVVAAALLAGGAAATFTVTRVAAGGGDDSLCTAQAIEDGSNDGEAMDDQQCTAELNGTDADAANEDNN